MDVSSTTTAAQATASRLESEISEARESSVSDFTDFLTLLTAQLKNQDPLQPLDSTQFVEQLASFSAVEQQVGTNEKLSRLVAQGAAQEVGELGGWIGQTVDARKASYTLDADGLTVAVPEQAGATLVEAIVTDASGDTVARLPVADTSVPFVWTGEREGGQRAAPGAYSVAFAYEFEGRAPVRIEPESAGRVVEARIDTEGALLILDTGARVRPGDVEALRLAEDENGAAA
jgi:flagellar basal-body rod modification protein FlgD